MPNLDSCSAPLNHKDLKNRIEYYSNMLVRFTTSRTSDANILWNIIEQLPNDPAGEEKRLKGRNIPYSLIRKFRSIKSDEKKWDLIYSFVERFHKAHKSELSSALKFFKRFYTHERLKFLISRVNTLLAIPYYFNPFPFVCVISGFFSTSAWEGRVFSVWYKHANLDRLPIFAIEFIESYIHAYLNKIKAKLNDQQRWALTEAIAFNISYIDQTVVTKLWPENKTSYTDANFYPQLRLFLQKVGNLIFKNKRDINTLIELTKTNFT